MNEYYIKQFIQKQFVLFSIYNYLLIKYLKIS